MPDEDPLLGARRCRSCSIASSHTVSICMQVEKDIGFVGEVTSVDASLLRTLVETDYIPVVASVASDTNGQALNVNADIAAGEVLPPRHLYAYSAAVGGPLACRTAPCGQHWTQRLWAQIAAALKAEKLILMTDVPGVLRDKNDIATKFTEMGIRETRELVAEGIIAGGMIPK